MDDYLTNLAKILESPTSEDDRMTPKRRYKSPNIKLKTLFTLESPPSSPNHSPKKKMITIEEDPTLSYSPRLLPNPLTKTAIRRTLSQTPVSSYKIESNMSDFYPHPIDCSKLNVIALCHYPKVQLLSIRQEITSLSSISKYTKIPVSLKFSVDGSHLFVGYRDGWCNIYDVSTGKLLNDYLFQSVKDITSGASVTCFDVIDNLALTAYTNGQIGLLDERSKTPIYAIKDSHNQTIVTVAINKRNPNIYASSGDESFTKIWDLRYFKEGAPLITFKEHKAAARGIAWCPHNNDIIATGGGMADKTLMIWDTLTGKTQKAVDLGSQICNVFWNKEYKEIVTTTGTSSNEITLWNDTTLKNVASINNHHDRILYSVMTPDNSNIITITSNDPLRLWNLFPKKPTLLSLR